MKPSKLLLTTFAAFSALAFGVATTNAVDTADNRPPDNRSNLTTQRFATDASQSSLKEVALGLRAAEQAQNPEVKAFAASMVTEHTKANETLKALVAGKDVKLDQQLDNSQQEDVNKIAANTAGFDKGYIDQTISDHRGAIQLYQRASKELSDNELRSFADSTLQTLEQHLATAKSIQDRLEKASSN